MLNRYIERASEIDFPHSNDLSEIMVYVKLPMFIFFSIGASKHRAWLETSRIKKSSALQPTIHVLEEGVWDFIVDRANNMLKLVRSKSPQSKELEDRSLMKEIEKDPQKVANTRQMQALYADYKFYGKDAVVHRE